MFNLSYQADVLVLFESGSGEWDFSTTTHSTSSPRLQAGVQFFNLLMYIYYTKLVDSPSRLRGATHPSSKWLAIPYITCFTQVFISSDVTLTHTCAFCKARMSLIRLCPSAHISSLQRGSFWWVTKGVEFRASVLSIEYHLARLNWTNPLRVGRMDEPFLSSVCSWLQLPLVRSLTAYGEAQRMCRRGQSCRGWKIGRRSRDGEKRKAQFSIKLLHHIL